MKSTDTRIRDLEKQVQDTPLIVLAIDPATGEGHEVGVRTMINKGYRFSKVLYGDDRNNRDVSLILDYMILTEQIRHGVLANPETFLTAEFQEKAEKYLKEGNEE